ncbi:pyridoxal-phosphate dependent enzyme [Ahrensia sp. R2A130]|uniref:pyridoxal-phosphate dependent enzyme n=1 Tax=Ahrensia sp. R2A130 TaxID=744979 RepID=UPI0001E08BF6|nr:pyridoxal-phosphate dependent enzyme [Ahrensia sp. R2A130]EFL89958.1 pyridoxal-5'-phosphate-dependent enzyme, beta subunit [Ahrensia sp. R2A130]
MSILSNPYRSDASSFPLPADVPSPSTAVELPQALLAHCPAHAATPMIEAQALADDLMIGALYIKDERPRMGLGSFKALGAAAVIADEAAQAADDVPDAATLKGRTYVTASAGNHGMSVAAGAAIFGANAIIYLSETVPAAFAGRLRDKGADVRIVGHDYEASMAAAMQCAKYEGATLLSDSSWDGYTALPHKLMEGYTVLVAEAVEQLDEAPTHIMLQAGVGGMAAAIAAYARKAWGDNPQIIVVEPDAAPALQAAIEAGEFVAATGPVSNMGRLDCKEASLIALKGLAHDADSFMTISDDHAARATDLLTDADLASTPSGAAGIAALFDPATREKLGMDKQSRVLCFLSEGADS